MKTLKTTLLIIMSDNRILLAMKKRGFGQGKYNGVGGKVEPGETVEQAMLRETREEIGVTPTVYEEWAHMTYDEYVKGERTIVDMTMFVASDYDGEISESEEMCLQWFDRDSIPLGDMFPDDRYWMPYLLAGKKFDGMFHFDEQFNVLSYDIKERLS